MDQASFGEVFRRLREERSLSQEKIAQLMSLDIQEIECWESGRSLPSKQQIAQLSDIFQVPPVVFFGKAGKRPKGAKIRGFLDIVSKFYLLITILCGAIVIIFYLLFLFLGAKWMENRLLLIIGTPVCTLFLYVAVRTLLSFLQKTPVCSPRALDIIEFVAFLVFALGAVSQTAVFLLDLKTGFTLSLSCEIAAICGILGGHHKRIQE